eukprot:1163080-Prorocentrum_lima.AAC.1
MQFVAPSFEPESAPLGSTNGGQPIHAGRDGVEIPWAEHHTGARLSSVEAGVPAVSVPLECSLER